MSDQCLISIESDQKVPVCLIASQLERQWLNCERTSRWLRPEIISIAENHR